MASARPRLQSLRSQVADIFKCSICLEIPTEPKVLPCMHFACLDCLERVVGHDRSNIQPRIRCPTCRGVHRIPYGGLSELPTDYKAIQVGDIVKLAGPGTLDHPEAVADTCRIDADSVAVRLHQYILRDDVHNARRLVDELSTLNRRRVVSSTYVIENKGDVTNNVMGTNVHAAILYNRWDFLTFLLMDCRADPDFSGEVQAANVTWTPPEDHKYKKKGGDVAHKQDKCRSRSDYSPHTYNRDKLGERPGYAAASSTKDSQETPRDQTTDKPRPVPPLWLAAERRKFDAVDILLDRGANINIRTSWGSSPLRVACFNNDLRLVRHLVNHGADTDVADHQGTTCVMYSACNNPDGRILEVLLSHNESPVDVQTKAGWTALHFAIANDNYDGAKVLLEHGADPNVQDGVLQQSAQDMSVGRDPRFTELLKRYTA